MAAGLVGGFGGAAATDGPETQPVQTQPSWVWRAEGDVEWAEPMGVGGLQPLLVADRDSNLYLLDARRGVSRLESPIAAGPGVRPVNSDAPAVVAASQPGEPRNVYCYDRYCVYAICAWPEARLLWQAGQWRPGVRPDGAASQAFQGDPEELRRIVGAYASAEGVLVARDDGRVALLGQKDGAVVWELKLPRSGNMRLHARGGVAAVLWEEQGRLRGTLVEVRTGARRELALPAEAAWPTYSAMSASGLVLVHPDRVSLWSADGQGRTVSSSPTAPVLASAVALDRGSSGAGDDRAEEWLVFGSGDGELRRLDLKTGQIGWAAADVEPDQASWSWVRARGDWVLAATAETLHLRDARSGRLAERIRMAEGGVHTEAPPDGVARAGASRFGARLLDAAVTGTMVWTLWEIDPLEHRLWLQGSAIAGAAGSAPAPRRYDLGTAEVFLGAAWSEDQVIVTTRDGLRAFVLKQAAAHDSRH